MRVNKLLISNILCFPYVDALDDAISIEFDDGMNIIIGTNGSGKSTAVEVLSAILKRVVAPRVNVDYTRLNQPGNFTPNELKQVLKLQDDKSYKGFRLSANREGVNKPQEIRVELYLDDVDKVNIDTIKANLANLTSIQENYSTRPVVTGFDFTEENVTIDLKLNSESATFEIIRTTNDRVLNYLQNYRLYKELVNIYNSENDELIDPIFDTFITLGGYRNYGAFSNKIELSRQSADEQLDKFRADEFNRSFNSIEGSEPTIFSIVRLNIAKNHQQLTLHGSQTSDEAVTEANDTGTMKKINNKLKIINIECSIAPIDPNKWSYGFYFKDLKTGQVIDDINSLSAGQKSIIHLVFEAYGRENQKGGLSIIDEPEIHLHYQFQHEYLKILEEIKNEQESQHILITHSESLINSETISSVKRFSLDKNGHTTISHPKLNEEQRLLVNILDINRSTHAFFAEKVLLVEGQDDRYFYTDLIRKKYPEYRHNLVVLSMNGKSGYSKWSEFFKLFDLEVSYSGDLDNAKEFGLTSSDLSGKSQAEIQQFKTDNPSFEEDLDSLKSEGVFILKDGDLEKYLDINKGLKYVIPYCEEQLEDDLKTSKLSEIIRNLETIIGT